MNKVFCQECQAIDITSTVRDNGRSTTLMYCMPFYDKDGKKHHHDTNHVTASYICSNGHCFSVKIYNTCWCGWRQEDSSARNNNI